MSRKKEHELKSNDELTRLVRSIEINTWDQLILFVRDLPYGRNSNRIDVSTVIKEEKGTCSSKHALLKELADLNSIPNVKLILGMYKMTKVNTPGIGPALDGFEPGFLPEAHCYLKMNNERVDFTSSTSNIKELESDLISEIEISPEQVAVFKIEYHHEYLKKWLNQMQLDLPFTFIWTLREKCIQNLENKS